MFAPSNLWNLFIIGVFAWFLMSIVNQIVQDRLAEEEENKGTEASAPLTKSATTPVSKAKTAAATPASKAKSVATPVTSPHTVKSTASSPLVAVSPVSSDSGEESTETEEHEEQPIARRRSTGKARPSDPYFEAVVFTSRTRSRSRQR